MDDWTIEAKPLLQWSATVQYSKSPHKNPWTVSIDGAHIYDLIYWLIDKNVVGALEAEILKINKRYPNIKDIICLELD